MDPKSMMKIKQVMDMTKTATPSKTAYQTNISMNNQAAMSQQPKTNREVLGEWYNLLQTDQDGAAKYLAEYRKAQATPDSPYFNPYTKPTNQAVYNMAALGYDVSNVGSDDWYETNAWMKNYYVTTGTTNEVKKPGKDSSIGEQAGYQHRQIEKRREISNKALSEWDAVQQEIQWLVNDPHQNLTDDEIVDRVQKEIDNGKYPTLKAMDEGREQNKPLELNVAVPYSHDNMYGAAWAARNQNPDGTYGNSNAELNTALYAAGQGNQWVENPEIRAKLDENSPTFSPYSVKATADDLCMYFGVYELTPQWAEENKAFETSDDPTDRKMYNEALKTIQYTQKLDDQRTKMQKQINDLIVQGKDADTIIKRVFDNSDYQDLFDLDLTMTSGSGCYGNKDLKPTAWAVDYKGEDVKQSIRDRIDGAEENNSKAVETINGRTNADVGAVNVGGLRGKPEQAPENAPEQAPEATAPEAENAPEAPAAEPEPEAPAAPETPKLDPVETKTRNSNRAQAQAMMDKFGTPSEQNAMQGGFGGADVIKAYVLNKKSLQERSGEVVAGDMIITYNSDYEQKQRDSIAYGDYTEMSVEQLDKAVEYLDEDYNAASERAGGTTTRFDLLMANFAMSSPDIKEFNSKAQERNAELNAFADEAKNAGNADSDFIAAWNFWVDYDYDTSERLDFQKTDFWKDFFDRYDRWVNSGEDYHDPVIEGVVRALEENGMYEVLFDSGDGYGSDIRDWLNFGAKGTPMHVAPGGRGYVAYTQDEMDEIETQIKKAIGQSMVQSAKQNGFGGEGNAEDIETLDHYDIMEDMELMVDIDTRKKWIESLRKEAVVRESYEDAVPEDGDCEYHGEVIGLPSLDYMVTDKDIHDIYKNANSLQGSGYSRATLMTTKQIRTFNYYYNKGDKETAMKYYESLAPYLDKKVTEAKKELGKELANNKYIGPLVGVSTVVGRIADLPKEMIATGGALLGVEEWQDPNHPMWQNLQYYNAIQEARAQSWDYQLVNWFGEGARGVGRFLNNTAYSIMQNVAVMAVSGGIAGGAEAISTGMVQLIMSSQAASSTMLECLEKHMDPTEAGIRAICTGCIEWVTEEISLEKLLKPDANDFMQSWLEAAKYFGKNVLAEASEEGASWVLEKCMDAVLSDIYAHPDEFESDVRAEMARLMAEEGITDEREAERLAMANVMNANLIDLATSMGAGGLSGFVLSTGRAGIYKMKTRGLGSTINSNGNSSALIDAVIGMEGNEKVQEAAKKAKASPTATNIGKLFNAMITSGDADIRRQALEICGFTEAQAAEATENAKEEQFQEEQEAIAQEEAAAEETATEAPAAETETTTEETTAPTVDEVTGETAKPETLAPGQYSKAERHMSQTLKTEANNWRDQKTNDMAALLEIEQDTTNSGLAVTDMATVLSGTVQETSLEPKAATAAAQTVVNGMLGGDTKAAANMARGVLNNVYSAREGTLAKEAIAWGAMTDGLANKTLQFIAKQAAAGRQIERGDVRLLISNMQLDQSGYNAKAYQQTYAAAIAQSDIDTRVVDKISQGRLAAETQKEQNALKAAQEVAEMEQRSMARAQAEAEAAGKNLEAAAAEYDPSPDRAETAAALEQAANHVAGTVNQKTQAEQAAQDAQRKVEDAQKALDKATEDSLNGMREEAKTEAAQEQQEQAQKEAEEKANAAKEVALRQQEQAEQDLDDSIENNDVEQMIEEQFPDATEEEKQHIREVYADEVAKERNAAQETTKEQKDLLTGEDYEKVSEKEMKKRDRLFKQLSRKFNVGIVIADTKALDAQNRGVSYAEGIFSNGYYDEKTNSIVLDKSVSIIKGMQKILGHELFHMAEKAKLYNALANTLLKMRYGEEYNFDTLDKQIDSGEIGGKIAADVLAKRKIYDSALGGTHSTRYLLEEIIGDQMGELLDNNRNADLINRLAAEEPSTLRRIADSIKSFLKKISGVKGEFVTEAQKTVDMMETALKQAQANRGIGQEGTRYSLPSETKTLATDSNGDEVAVELPGGTVSIDSGMRYSLSTFTENEQNEVKQALYNATNPDGSKRFTRQEVDQFIKDATGIASIIANDKLRLDFKANEFQSFLKKNQDYFFTLDASTLCAKRLLYQGTFNYLQSHFADMQNEALMPDDLIDLVNIMRDMGYETPCGICYVESRRRWLDKYAQEWLDSYEGENKPTLAQLTTSDGLQELRANPETRQIAEAFIDAMNAKGSANPKVVQLRTAYNGDIRKLSKGDIQKVKDIGGLRIQSFSDFETPHLLDMMQAVMDMAAVGLTSQAYTKVPNFAWVFGDTGIKINLSLIGKGTGLDADGNLVFDNIEGMNFDEAMKLRDRYSANVGTILVGINDDHIIAAMGDPRIDFIIPFHRSGWSKGELSRISVLNNYSDYTDTQNERFILGEKYTEIKDKGQKAVDNWIAKNGEKYPGYQVIDQGNGKYTIRFRDGYESESFQKHKERTGESLYNFEPVGANKYWDFELSGEENSRNYLKMCAEQHRLPKFWQFLVDNGDGSFSLPEGDDKRSTAIRTGYWKTLIDFKMYDNNGVGSEQKEVTPNINMNQAQRVLNDYGKREDGTYKLGRKQPNGQWADMESNDDLPTAIPAAEAMHDYLMKVKRPEQQRRAEQRAAENEAKLARGETVKPESDQKRDERIAREGAEMYNMYAKSAFGAYMGDATLGNTPSENTEEFANTARQQMAIDAETGETIRRSLPQDAPYMAAVERGDMGEAQREVREKAAESGVYTNEKGKPIKLYHGTRTNFGFTVFDTLRAKFGLGAIFTTSNQSVANGYSEFGNDRGASSKYIDDDGTDETIIRNARNVLNSDVSRLTDEKANELRQKHLDAMKKQAEAENKAMEESPDYTPPYEIESSFWRIVQANNDMLNEDPLLFDEDREYRDSYRETYSDWNRQNLVDAMDELKQYYNEHPDEMNRLKTEGSGYYNLLFRGYEQSDSIIDMEYGYKKLLKDNIFIFNATDQLITRDDLQDHILNEQGKGNYALYGYPGNKPFIVDANKSFWTGIEVPEIGEGFFSTDDIVKWAKNNGYTSVVIKNVMDPGVVNAYGDDYIFFNSSQVKSADTVTYDGQGNVIPLSERFTSSPDIRYSIPSDDMLRQQIRLYRGQAANSGNALPPGNGTDISTNTGDQNRTGQRQFGNKTAQESNALHQQVKDYLFSHSSYVKDSNSAQIDRAVDWVRNKATEGDLDGYYAALDEVTSDDFDYRSADGQARMLTVMSMAALKAQSGDRSAMNDELRIADAYNKQGTDIGRMLQSRKIFRLMTPLGRRTVLQNEVRKLNDIIGRRGGNTEVSLSEDILREAEEAKTEEDFAKVQKKANQELAKQMPSNWRDKMRAWRMTSMLLNPRTHVRNILGNMFFVPAVGLKNKIGALMELRMDKGNRTKTLRPFLPSDIRQFANEDAKTMKDVTTGEAKYNEETQVERQKKTFGNGKGIVSRTAGRALQWLSDINSKALEGEDWLFLKGHYRRALGGYMVANGYSVEDMQNNPELLQKARTYAINEAQKATYRDFNRLAATLNKVSRDGGVAGFLVDAALPFKKTPANILRRGIEYSPLGIARSLTTDAYHLKQYMDYQSGKRSVLPDRAISPNQFIDRLSSGLSGTAVFALGALLSNLGVLTVGLDDDDDKFAKERGEQEYSIKLFGQDISYTVDWAAPMSMPLFVGAATHDLFENDSNGFDVDGMLNAFGAISEPVFNLSMLDGVNSLFKTSQYDDTNTITQIGAKIATNYATSFVPAIAGTIARINDPYRRKAYVESGKGTGIMGTLRYAYEQTQNKIPGWGKNDNIPYRDVWGEPVQSGSVERHLENIVSPGYYNEISDDPILNEMERVYQDTGDTGIVSCIEDPPKSFSQKGNKYVLNDKQWDAYKEYRGKTAKPMLDQLMATNDYQNASAEEQALMIKGVWSYADKVGKNAAVPEYKMDNYGANPVGTVISDSKTSYYNSEMIKAMDCNDWTAFEDTKQALLDNYQNNDGLTEKEANSKVKDKIGNTYRDMYKEAYRNVLNGVNVTENQQKMLDIEGMLDSTGYDFNYDGKGGWVEQVDREFN